MCSCHGIEHAESISRCRGTGQRPNPHSKGLGSSICIRLLCLLHYFSLSSHAGSWNQLPCALCRACTAASLSNGPPSSSRTRACCASPSISGAACSSASLPVLLVTYYRSSHVFWSASCWASLTPVSVSPSKIAYKHDQSLHVCRF